MATAKKTSTSTAVAKRPGGAVVSIQDQLKKLAANQTERLPSASGITIGVGQDKMFKFPDGTRADTFTGVVVDYVATNFYYEDSYDKDNIKPPACFAIGTLSNDKLTPSANSPAQQAASCGACPMNVFGSGGKGKACKNGYTLAVLPPDATVDTPIWLLKVSPTALKAWGAYVRSISSVFETIPVGVTTTFTFDENSDYASIRFNDPAPNENLETCFSRMAEAKKLLETEPDVSAYDAPAPVKSKAPVRKVAGARR